MPPLSATLPTKSPRARHGQIVSGQNAEDKRGGSYRDRRCLRFRRPRHRIGVGCHEFAHALQRKDVSSVQWMGATATRRWPAGRDFEHRRCRRRCGRAKPPSVSPAAKHRPDSRRRTATAGMLSKPRAQPDAGHGGALVTHAAGLSERGMHLMSMCAAPAVRGDLKRALRVGRGKKPPACETKRPLIARSLSRAGIERVRGGKLLLVADGRKRAEGRSRASPRFNADQRGISRKIIARSVSEGVSETHALGDFRDDPPIRSRIAREG